MKTFQKQKCNLCIGNAEHLSSGIEDSKIGKPGQTVKNIDAEGSDISFGGNSNF